MSNSDWLSPLIAGASLVLSAAAVVWQYRYRRDHDRRADVTVAFHWLTSSAAVVLPGREPIYAGYHLVIANRGPAVARNVGLAVEEPGGTALKLLDIADDELPLAILDAGSRYPIPWVVEPFTRHARRFTARLTRDDADGHQKRVVPLRRGQLPPA
jgi:hypothetical protein